MSVDDGWIMARELCMSSSTSDRFLDDKMILLNLNTLSYLTIFDTNTTIDETAFCSLFNKLGC